MVHAREVARMHASRSSSSIYDTFLIGSSAGRYVLGMGNDLGWGAGRVGVRGSVGGGVGGTNEGRSRWAPH